MKKRWVWALCLIGLLSTSAAAENEESAFNAEDFDRQNIFWVDTDDNTFTCQAVRIAPKWYLTAAHCVRPMCDNGFPINRPKNHFKKLHFLSF